MSLKMCLSLGPCLEGHYPLSEKEFPGCAGHCVSWWTVASVRGMSEAIPPSTRQ